jgi:hypothetical protein
MKEETAVSADGVMQSILKELLTNNIDITAREVARRHPSINAASSITRIPERRKLLEEYQAQQKTFREWAARSNKSSPARLQEQLAKRDLKIQELEHKVMILTASHVAMIKAVGELGGFPKWAAFFEKYEAVRKQLEAMGAMPKDNVTPIVRSDPAQQ